jgi:hypothetical protein
VAAIEDEHAFAEVDKTINDVVTEYGRRAGMGSPENVELIRALADNLYADWREQQILAGASPAEIDKLMGTEYGFEVAGAAIEQAIPLAKDAHIRRRMMQKLGPPGRR